MAFPMALLKKGMNKFGKKEEEATGAPVEGAKPMEKGKKPFPPKKGGKPFPPKKGGFPFQKGNK